MTLVRYLAGSLAVLVIGGMFWAGIDNMSSPQGGASFAGLVWIVIGLPVSFLLYPLAWFITGNLAPRLRYCVFPSVVVIGAIAVTILGSLPDASSGVTSADISVLVTFAIAVFVSWAVYVKIVDVGPGQPRPR